MAAAAGARRLHGDRCRVLARGRCVRRREGGRRSGSPDADDRFSDSLRHLRATAAATGPSRVGIAYFAVGAIHITGPGVLPEDGFTGYAAEGSPTPGVARWGDYSAAVYGDGAVWMGNEFIPNAPRTLLASWGTFLSRLPA